MEFRDRIKDFQRIKASDLIVNENNWRVHSSQQESAIRTVLKEIGFASACLVRENDNGQFELIDGHLRADVAGYEEVPCLILDVTESEADKLLATFDSVTTMAETDQDALDDLINGIVAESNDFQDLLDSMVSDISEELAGETELKQIDVKPPPALTWVLIGIPTVQFAEISETVELVASMDSTFVETSFSDKNR